MYLYMYRHNLHDNRKKYVSNSSVINEAENARTVVQKLLEPKKKPFRN